MRWEQKPGEDPKNFMWNTAQNVVWGFHAKLGSEFAVSTDEIRTAILDEVKSSSTGSISPEVVETIMRLIVEFKGHLLAEAWMRHGGDWKKLKSFTEQQMEPYIGQSVMILDQYWASEMDSRRPAIVTGKQGRKWEVRLRDGGFASYSLKEIAPIPPADSTS